MWWGFIVVRFNCRFLSMDEVTMKVMLSCSCKMADITDEGISCDHCFSDIYIACSCCNDKTINNLIINSSNRMFCPSVQWMGNFQCLSCVTVVEDLNKQRQPPPALDAVYLIKPDREISGLCSFIFGFWNVKSKNLAQSQSENGSLFLIEVCMFWFFLCGVR